jgi:hypothetical protein
LHVEAQESRTDTLDIVVSAWLGQGNRISASCRCSLARSARGRRRSQRTHPEERKPAFAKAQSSPSLASSSPHAVAEVEEAASPPCPQRRSTLRPPLSLA